MSSVAAEEIRLFPSPESESPAIAHLDLSRLYVPPVTHDIDDLTLPPTGEIRPLYFESLPYKGQPTRIFAWLGVPSCASESEPVPGIVLVHGGGGTAYRDWVQLWVDRGYAAIAIDTGGRVPLGVDGMRLKTKRHDFAGPPSSSGGFPNALDPIEDQWPFHAIVAIIQANSLLASQPNVDAERIGITGVSWGGLMTENASSVDKRFKFSVPVYGCGFLGEDSHWLDTTFQELPPETVARWIELWDPSQFLGADTGATDMRFFFVNGTNDKHFRPGSWRRTTQLAETAGYPVARVMKVRMPHDHPPAGDPEEITIFADSIVKGGAPLAQITSQGVREGYEVWVAWTSSEGFPVVNAELVYTSDDGPWPSRYWQTASAELDTNTASVVVPTDATAWYFNLYDTRGAIVSSEHQDRSCN